MTNSTSSHSGGGAVAVTPHHDATRAALRVMEAKGTAADAGIAANAVLGMVLPSTCGIGGDLFALVQEPGMTRPDVLNASGRGGSGLSAANLSRVGHARMPTYGTSTISVPGCVDGWEALQDRYGRLDLGEVLAAAIWHRPLVALQITGEPPSTREESPPLSPPQPRESSHRTISPPTPSTGWNRSASTSSD